MGLRPVRPTTKIGTNSGRDVGALFRYIRKFKFDEALEACLHSTGWKPVLPMLDAGPSSEPYAIAKALIAGRRAPPVAMLECEVRFAAADSQPRTPASRRRLGRVHHGEMMARGPARIEPHRPCSSMTI